MSKYKNLQTTMKTIMPMIAVLLLMAAGCQDKEQAEMLQRENEELKAELTRAQAAVQTFEQVGTLIDSIDRMRNTLALSMESGTSYEDYLKKMEEITDYVQQSEQKISELEREIASSTAQGGKYAAAIARLKKDLAEKSEEIQTLQAKVEEYRNENEELLSTVDLQKSEIEVQTEELERKREELALIENRIQELMVQSQVNEADAYFARAAAVEEAARRTKLAPKKKKETYKEAMELYQKALSYGREDAEAKVNELKEKI
jgi:chromosome segregation ATPase